jgi:hypothetical protein
MKFEQKNHGADTWFGTTVAPTFKLTPLEACHAVMLSEHDEISMQRADLDKAVRDELLAHGTARLDKFPDVVDDMSEERLQARWDWARVELFKNFPELYGKLPALYE